MPDAQPTSVAGRPGSAALVQGLCAAPCRERQGRDLVGAVEPAARELGTWELVETLREPVEALRQLEGGPGRWARGGRGRSRATLSPMKSLRAALYPLRLVGARLSRRSAPVVLVVLGIAAGASVVLGGRAGALVAQGPRCRAGGGESGSRTASARSVPSGSASRVRATSRSPCSSGLARAALASDECRAAQPRSSSSARARSGGLRRARRSRGARELGPTGSALRGRARRSGARCCGCAARDGAADRRDETRRGGRGGPQEPRAFRRFPRADRQRARGRRGEPVRRAAAGYHRPPPPPLSSPRRDALAAPSLARDYRSYAWVAPLEPGGPGCGRWTTSPRRCPGPIGAAGPSPRFDSWRRSRRCARRRRLVAPRGGGWASSAARLQRSSSRSRCSRR